MVAFFNGQNAFEIFENKSVSSFIPNGRNKGLKVIVGAVALFLFMALIVGVIILSVVLIHEMSGESSIQLTKEKEKYSVFQG